VFFLLVGAARERPGLYKSVSEHCILPLSARLPIYEDTTLSPVSFSSSTNYIVDIALVAGGICRKLVKTSADVYQKQIRLISRICPLNLIL